MITKSYVFDIKLQQRQETRAMLEHGRAVLEGRDIGNQYGVSCPDCYAANTKRIPYILLVFLRCGGSLTWRSVFEPGKASHRLCYQEAGEQFYSQASPKCARATECVYPIPFAIRFASFCLFKMPFAFL